MADALPIEQIAHTIEVTIISYHSWRWFEEKNSLQVIMTSLPVVERSYPWLKDLTRGWTILPVASYYKLYYAIVTRG